MATKSLTFDIYGRDKNASKTMRKVGGEADDVGARFKRFGVVAAAGLAVAAGAAIKFGADSVRAYAEAEEAQNRLAFAYEQFPALADVNIDAMRRLNTEMAKKTRYDDDAYALGQAQLAQYGLTGQQIMELTPLLADYAGKTGKDLPTAAEDLGKALLGQGRALKDIGIDFQDTGSVAGNFDAIMRGLRDQVGGFAEQDAQTAAGKLDNLKNRFGELQEAVGEKLIGPLTDAMDELEDSGGVEKLGDALAGVVQGFTDLEKSTGWLGDFLDEMSEFGDFVDDIQAAVDALGSGNFDKMSEWAGDEFGEGGLMGQIFGGEWFKNPPVPPLPASMQKMFDDTKVVTDTGVESVRTGMGGGFSRMGVDIDVFRAATGEKFGGTWSDADGRTRAGIGAMAASTGSGLLDAMGRILGFSGQVGPQFGTAWAGADAATVGGWGNIERSTGAGVGKVGAKAGEIGAAVRAPFSGAASWLFGAGEDIVSGLINGLRGMIGDAANTAANLAAATVKAAKDALGIKSPSRVFAEIGMNVGAGFDQGMEKSMANAYSSMEALAAPPVALKDQRSVTSSSVFSMDGVRVVLEIGGRPIEGVIRQEASAVVGAYDQQSARAGARGSTGY